MVADPVHLYVALSGMVPALVAMWLVDRLDAKRPEPLSLRLLVAAVGVLSFIPALIIERYLMLPLGEQLFAPASYDAAGFNAYVLAGATEEACKILVVYWVVWKRPEFDERMDGIVYAARAGLGFALIENVGYLYFQAPALNDQIGMWILRAILAVPGHAIWTGVIGALAARRRFDHRGLGIVGGYLLAVAFHGTYDFSVFVRVPLAARGHSTLADVLALAPFALTFLGILVLRALAAGALSLDDRAAAAAAAARARVLIQPVRAKP